MSDVEIEHVVRVTAPSSRGVGAGPIVRTFTWAEAVQAGYDWGRVDGQHAADDRLLFGEDKEWTVAGVPLAQLRSKLGSARRDG
jgi:hypothetical protein